MKLLKILIVSLACLTIGFAVELNCIVSNYTQAESISSNCLEIQVNDLIVPANKTLTFNLQNSTTLTFKGNITWSYSQWKGPLVLIKGHNITVRGEKGHVFDGRGYLWWDGHGQYGKVKPKFIRTYATESLFENLYFLNSPVHCMSTHNSENTIYRNWTIDVSLAGKLGVNTDGVGVSQGKNLLFQNFLVKNQDDCVVINSGSDLTFENLECHGSHGLSFGVASSFVSNVIFRNSKVIDADNGIHIKTQHLGGYGEISNVTYENIELRNITNYAISIEQDYFDRGHPSNNVVIKDLKIYNVYGTMSSARKNTAVQITCAIGGCENWHFGDINITGAYRDECSGYEPEGYKCNNKNLLI